MGALCTLIWTGSFEGKDLRSRRRSDGLKINVMRNRSRARNAAERTQFEFCVRSAVVMQMDGHSRHGGRTQLQRKGYAVRGHEADRNIGTKQQQGQQQDAGPAASLPKFKTLSHSSSRGGYP